MGTDTGSITVTFLGVLVVIVVLFLICREIVCWYWKVNEGLELLREIRDRLSEINLEQIAGPVAVTAQPAGPVDPWGKRPCPHCGKKISNNDQTCIHCDKDVPDLTKG